MSNLVSQQIRLKNRIVGMPKESDFELVEAPLPEPAAGEVLVQNLYTSVDPYMRGGMRSAELGKPLEGRCAGQIVQSNSDQFQVGDYVTGMLGWRDHYVAPAGSVTAVDTTIAPLQSFLGAVGMPGRTAYFGFLEIGQPKAGETVFVSAAAGAVGSIVCQIAKIKGVESSRVPALIRKSRGYLKQQALTRHLTIKMSTIWKPSLGSIVQMDLTSTSRMWAADISKQHSQ